MTAPDLSALVGARLCHDLISPLGAIGNGLELMRLPGATGAAELALISGSLDTALAKLRFFRVAFGPAEAQARLSFEEAAAITGAMFTGRFTVRWTAPGADIARPIARLVLLALLCVEKSLPMGGQVRVSRGPRGLTLAVEGRRTVPLAELWAHVTAGSPVPGLKADAVQFALLRAGLEAAGQPIEVRLAETAISVTLTEAAQLSA